MKRKLTILTLIAFLAIGGVVCYLAFPPGLPIYLTLPGKPSRVERRFCADWHPKGSGEWWLIVERGGDLDRELRKATAIQFEIDNGSGLADVKLAEEEPYRLEQNSIAHALLPGCSRLLVSRSDPSKLIAIHLERRRD